MASILSLIPLFLFQVLLPLITAWWLAFRPARSKAHAAMKLLIALVFGFWIFWTQQWQIFSYLLRYITAGLMFSGAVWGMRRFPELPAWRTPRAWGWAKIVLEILFLLSAGFLDGYILKSFRPKEPGLAISFPLKRGYIGHGGAEVILNYHNEDSTSQQYALDILRLNDWGMRAEGLFPASPERYVIYGDTVFAPCNAVVVKAVDGLPNVPPGKELHVNPAGNHIVLEYRGCLIVFAHLKPGSVQVRAGEAIHTGMPMAQVGNSGHTSEPHLHMHAVRGTDTSGYVHGGNGIPLFFGGKFPVRNDIVRGSF